MLLELLEPDHRDLYSRGVPSAAIVTIGNELVSGDVENTNGSWLARRLEALGVDVGLVAAIPDEIETIAAFVRERAPQFSVVVVTGGLGGTPDDLTREGIAAAFGVGQDEEPLQAARLRERFADRNPAYAVRWAQLPAGSRAIENPLGGAPGFALENVYVLPGLPREMEAMFELIADELGGAAPIVSWRRRYRTTESRIVAVLEEMGARHPRVRVGSYPSFEPERTVEVVVKSSDPEELEAASAWIEQALEDATGR
jgi:molybdenum cofactor synthesis domain-containing protein